MYILVVEKFTNIPVNTTTVTVQSSSIEINASFLGNGLYLVNIPLPKRNFTITFTVEGEGYATLTVDLDLTAQVSGQLVPENNLLLLIVAVTIGIILGSVIGVVGYVFINNRISGKRTFFRPQYLTGGKAFYCELDKDQHPATDSAYQCVSCSRLTCTDCYEASSTVGVPLCPYCQGKLVRVQ